MFQLLVTDKILRTELVCDCSELLRRWCRAICRATFRYQILTNNTHLLLNFNSSGWGSRFEWCKAKAGHHFDATCPHAAPRIGKRSPPVRGKSRTQRGGGGNVLKARVVKFICVYLEYKCIRDLSLLNCGPVSRRSLPGGRSEVQDIVPRGGLQESPLDLHTGLAP